MHSQCIASHMSGYCEVVPWSLACCLGFKHSKGFLIEAFYYSQVISPPWHELFLSPHELTAKSFSFTMSYSGIRSYPHVTLLYIYSTHAHTVHFPYTLWMLVPTGMILSYKLNYTLFTQDTSMYAHFQTLIPPWIRLFALHFKMIHDPFTSFSFFIKCNMKSDNFT